MTTKINFISITLSFLLLLITSCQPEPKSKATVTNELNPIVLEDIINRDTYYVFHYDETGKILDSIACVNFEFKNPSNNIFKKITKDKIELDQNYCIGDFNEVNSIVEVTPNIKNCQTIMYSKGDSTCLNIPKLKENFILTKRDSKLYSPNSKLITFGYKDEMNFLGVGYLDKLGEN